MGIYSEFQPAGRRWNTSKTSSPAAASDFWQRGKGTGGGRAAEGSTRGFVRLECSRGPNILSKTMVPDSNCSYSFTVARN